MGYILVDDFTDNWAKEDSSDDFYSLSYTDWTTYFQCSQFPKDRTLVLGFDNESAVITKPETYVAKVFTEKQYFSGADEYGVSVVYKELTLSASLYPARNPTGRNYKKPSDFNFSLSLYDNGNKLREWFLPLRPGCKGSYTSIKLDLLPLIENGFDGFDEIRIGILGYPGLGTQVYFRDVYLNQDEVEHNLKVTMAYDLNNKIRRKVGNLYNTVSAGSTFIEMSNVPDIDEYMCIAIGDVENDNFEQHVIKSAIYDDGTNKYHVEFTGEFDTEVLQYDWPAGTPIYFVVPAVYKHLSESESVFPVFYISSDAPEPVEERTNMGYHLSNYVRDDLNGHFVARHLSEDIIAVPITVSVFSNTPEVAAEMWRLLRGIYDQQSHINVAGVLCDYEIVGSQSNLKTEQDGMPHYDMDMVVYSSENVHDKEYLIYPSLKSLDIGVDSVDTDHPFLIGGQVTINI